MLRVSRMQRVMELAKSHSEALFTLATEEVERVKLFSNAADAYVEETLNSKATKRWLGLKNIVSGAAETTQDKRDISKNLETNAKKISIAAKLAEKNRKLKNIPRMTFAEFYELAVAEGVAEFDGISSGRAGSRQPSILRKRSEVLDRIREAHSRRASYVPPSDEPNLRNGSTERRMSLMLTDPRIVPMSARRKSTTQSWEEQVKLSDRRKSVISKNSKDSIDDFKNSGFRNHSKDSVDNDALLVPINGRRRSSMRVIEDDPPQMFSKRRASVRSENSNDSQGYQAAKGVTTKRKSIVALLAKIPMEIRT